MRHAGALMQAFLAIVVATRCCSPHGGSTARHLSGCSTSPSAKRAGAFLLFEVWDNSIHRMKGFLFPVKVIGLGARGCACDC